MYDKLSRKRELIWRKALEENLFHIAEQCENDPKQARNDIRSALDFALQQGRNVIWERLEAGEQKGVRAAAALSYLTDQVIRALYTVTTERLYPRDAKEGDEERIALVAVGGYGRRELAPFSDIDIMFLVPEKHGFWVETVSEYMLYLLWDLGLKVGHAIRTNAECISLAKADLTIQTALLDARLIWGDEALYAETATAFKKKVIAGKGKAFVEAKLAERDARHAKLGDTRYVVEPNLKEGKGGLRDLHTLFWIGRFLHSVERFTGLSRVGALTESEVRQFRKAEDFLWTVRFYLHFLSNRAEERLTFDWQQELSERLHYRSHPGLSGVERFMKHYFLVAKEVGDLTRIFCASLEEAQLKKTLRRRLERRKKIDEFILEGERLNFMSEKTAQKDPVLMIKIFWVADQEGIDIHPDALRFMGRNLTRVDATLRGREDANAYFMDILTRAKDTEGALRRMNEAGVFGRFLPDFGRIVAQSQFDMYHHFTVDEHTIQAIGLLSEIEKGNLATEHPISTEVIQKIGSRRALYVAVLFHDIAKGRGGDHSQLGAEMAQREGPRLGLNPAEVEQVVWLVRHHLLMSRVAFKRDVSDPKTVQDFAAMVKSPERLKMLLALTVVDIRAVGPGTWNEWKARLLGDLYRTAESRLVAGHMTIGRKERVLQKQAAVTKALKRNQRKGLKAHFASLPDSYWIAEDTETQIRDFHLVREVRRKRGANAIRIHTEWLEDAARVTVIAPGSDGVFCKIAGAIAGLRADILDAKIFTTTYGMAVDHFVVRPDDDVMFQTPSGQSYVAAEIHKAILTDVLPDRSVMPSQRHRRADVFHVAPFVLIDNKASNNSTVVEINARDRLGLLYDLAKILLERRVAVQSAHIATWGERAVDVFYVHEADGRKVTNGSRKKALKRALLAAVGGESARKVPLSSSKRRGAAAIGENTIGKRAKSS